MDFEQELKELIKAALDAGTETDTIIWALKERANFLTLQEAELQKAENDDDVF